MSMFLDLKPGTLCFAGKEVFYDVESAEILYDAIDMKKELQRSITTPTEIGVITNGILLNNFKDTLPLHWPDYFDISIDGLPEQHDEIRGQGAFKKLESNLVWLRNAFNGNIWITHTILNNNINSLPEFVQFMQKNFGINKFSVGFYRDTEYTDQNLKLSENDFHSIFSNTFHRLSQINLSEPVEVILEFDSTQNELIPLLKKTNWVTSLSAFSSTTYKFDNALTLKMNVAQIPVGFWRSVRVSPEGYWLAAEDLFDVRRYDKLSGANLKELNFNANALYEAGLNSKRFDELCRTNIKEIKKHLYDVNYQTII
jgi:hypothetical protein